MTEVEDLSARTDELVREAEKLAVEAERQADQLDLSLSMLRDELARGWP